jgi:putative ABC transport system substrate-binding protein
MKRREFVTLLGGVATWPLVARAQQSRKVWRIGALSGAARPASLESSPYGGLTQGLRELGYVEGRDFVLEWRFAEARPERYMEFAAELVRLKVDVFVAGAPQAVPAMQQAGPTIPIVLGVSTDPVGYGFAASLARPGGNITGLANSFDDTAPKQLELLAAAVPNLSRLGVLGNSSGPNLSPVMKKVKAAAQTAGVALVTADARNAEDFDTAFALLVRERVQALMVVSDVLFNLNRNRVAQFATHNRLPSMFSVREYVEAGGLMSYGESFREFYRRAARYVDKIIKGAKPGDLPIEQPNLFYLTINLKTAKALGLTIPQSLLLRADEVIQ